MALNRHLFIEGPNDERVTYQIIVARELLQHGERIISHVGGGIEELLQKKFPTYLKTATSDDIAALIIDADNQPASRWQRFQNSMMKAGYRSIPTAPDPIGTIIVPPAEALLPRVGFWMMPDNLKHGSLEDFLQSLIPVEQNDLYDFVTKTVDRIPDDLRPFDPPPRLKSILHTYLAWQREPGLPYGTSSKAGYFDANAPAADPFADWLKRLFQPDPLTVD
jgi:hypothetical protein